MTDKLTPSEIETLRGKVMRDEIAFVDPQNWPAFLSKDEALRYLDRLSPAPEPEVDEATVWARKVFQAIYKLPDGDHGHEGGAPFNRVRAYLRQAIAELIASKDGEIATLSELRKVAARNAGAADRARFKAESELATLRAENERLKDTISDLGVDLDEWQRCERAAGNIPSPKAAERNTAEPLVSLASGEPKIGGWTSDAKYAPNEPAKTHVWPATHDDACSEIKATETTPDVVVTQEDREAAAELLSGATLRCQKVQAMTTNPEVLRIAREVAASLRPYSHNSALILDGERDGIDIVQVAIAAIERTTVLSGTLAKKVGQCANTSGRGSCCETLGEDIERDLLDYDHLRQPEKGSTDE